MRTLVGCAIAIALWTATGALAQTPRAMSESEVKASGSRQVGGADIKRQYLGNTVYVLLLKNSGGAKAGSVFPLYHRDERVRIARTPASPRLEASWWIDGNTYCNEQRVMNAGHQCYTVWEGAGGSYLCLQPAGDCLISFRIVPGNAENF